MDPPKTRKFHNASLEQLILSLDPMIYSGLIADLQAILVQLRIDSKRISNWRNKWVGHRDYDVVTGVTAMPAINLLEMEKVSSGLHEFMYKFEEACHEPKEQRQVSIDRDKEQNAAEIEEWEQLKIDSPFDYKTALFVGYGGKLLQVIEHFHKNTDE